MISPGRSGRWCQPAARPGNGPEPCSTEGSSIAPAASTALRSVSLGTASLPSRTISYSRPPMNRAEGTGWPRALTFTSTSRAGSSTGSSAPIAMAITQVPVETTAKGAARPST